MIDTPQAIKFSNEYVRTLADQFAGAYALAQNFVALYYAKGLAAQFPDDDKEIVNDGAERDGRTPITGHDVNQMLVLCKDLIAMGTGDNTKMPSVLKASVDYK